jgi:hypothetical protein
MTRLGGRTMTVRAFIFHLKLKWILKTKYCLLERQAKIYFNVTPPTRAALLLLSTAKELPKDITKTTVTKVKMHILATEPAKPFKRITFTRCAATNTGVTKLIVPFTSLNFVSSPPSLSG